jgi:hypothetical protein
MRSIILTLFVYILISTNTNAQYRINKTRYNYRTYRYQAGDPFNPDLAGFTSFLLPGLGQMISGEHVRGAVFLGAFAGGATMIIGGIKLSETYTEESPGNEGSVVAVACLVTFGFIDMVAVDIWAIIDARHVAKVNNLASRDKAKAGSRVIISPYIGNLKNERVPVGLSMKVKF